MIKNNDFIKESYNNNLGFINPQPKKSKYEYILEKKKEKYE